MSFPISSSSGKAFIQIYLILILGLFCWSAYRNLYFPYGLDYGEAPLIDQTRRLENNQQLYKSDINSPPYIVSNYPPLYLLLVAALNSSISIPLFQAGRVVSIIFSLASAAIIGSFGFYLTGNKWLGVLSVAIFLSNMYVLLWSSLARVDMMALGLSLLGLWVLYRYGNHYYGILLSCLFFILSIYTRQTYLLAGPLAGIAWLWQVNKRRALLFVLILGLTSLASFGILNVITHGGFYSNIVLANINQYELSRTLIMFKQLIIMWPVIFIIAMIAIIVVFRSLLTRTKSITEHEPIYKFTIFGLGFYSLGALASAITVGKVGSDVNYFLELIAVCSIWCVIGLKYLSEQRSSIKSLSLAFISFQLLWVLITSLGLSRSLIEERWNNLANYEGIFNQVQKATQAGTVLSDDYLDMVVLSGQYIYYQPFEYGQLYYAGLWDPSQFVARLEQGSFPLILIGGDTVNKACCWPPPVAEAIDNAYIKSIDETLVILTPTR